MLTDALTQAAVSLRPLLRRMRADEISGATAILSRVGDAVLAHAPVRLRRPLREGDLYQRPHIVGMVVTTSALDERVTRTRLVPGVYAVTLRPVCGETFAFDLLDAGGERCLAAPAQAHKAAERQSARRISPFGFDVDIDNLDDIVNPYAHVICVSFLHWRVCFDIPVLQL